MARRTGSTAKAVTPEQPATAIEAEVEIKPVEETVVKEVYRVKEIDPNSYTTVRNGFHGMLVYKSRRTGERFVWQEFGDEQDMELQELKSCKNASKGYFENGWFLIDDPAVIEWLGAERYYANALSYDEFDELFEMSPADIKKRVAKLSKGQRDTVAYRARRLIADGQIDSLKVIDALEEATGRTLVER